MRAVLARIYRLTRLAASGPGAALGCLAYAAVLALQFVGVWVTVQLIAWNKAFYDALEAREAAAALTQLGSFAGFIALSVASFLAGDWLRKRLLMRWRQTLTERVTAAWLGHKAYWHLRPGFSPAPVDNPDQRIAEDCRLFVSRLLVETLDLISSVVALVSYLAVLWSLSSFPLSFPLFGLDITIPRYMVWAAFLYVALSSLATHLLGRPLKGLFFEQERREADFRHALIQVREGADEVAQAGGEAAETRRLDGLFALLKANWYRVINAELVLGLFTRPYQSTILRLPTFLALPAYFLGNLTLGGLMQLASAFSNVATTLSWFIFSYKDLAEFVAVTERLDTLLQAAAAPRPMPGVARAIRRDAAEGVALTLTGLRLTTPQGVPLAPVPDVTLPAGGTLWLCGRSGIGKSTLLSAIAGLWPYGQGAIGLAPGAFMLLPQVPRVFPQGLAHAVTYPLDPAEVGRPVIEAAMARVGLAHRLAALDVPGAEGYAGLSVGERQRLALARVLLARPRLLLLDEATSALDASAEAELLGLLRAELPGLTLICAAHRPPEALGPYQILALDPAAAADRSSQPLQAPLAGALA